MARSDHRRRRTLGLGAALALSTLACEGDPAAAARAASIVRAATPAAAAPSRAAARGAQPDGAVASSAARKPAGDAQRVESQQAAVASGDERTDAAGVAAAVVTDPDRRDGASPDAGDSAPDREDDEPARHDGDLPGASGDDAGTAQFMAAMARTISDLEYNAAAGLPEPPQQNVLPPPPAWKPPANADDNAKPLIQDVLPGQGAATGGERVTIRGKNLQPSAVLFGLSPARILGVAEDAVTVLSPPAGAGPVSIVVTNPDGNYAISATPFRYYR